MAKHAVHVMTLIRDTCALPAQRCGYMRHMLLAILAQHRCQNCKARDETDLHCQQHTSSTDSIHISFQAAFPHMHARVGRLQIQRTLIVCSCSERAIFTLRRSATLDLT